MTSHEWAKRMEELSKFLLSKPEFKVPDYCGNESIWYFLAKGDFLASVQALGTGNKATTDKHVKFYPVGAPMDFHVYVERSEVCRLVKPAEYDCEPLLSQLEEASLEAPSNG